MIRNYFIITFRNFFRNRNYAFINILGLSIGITCCIVIYLMVMHDLSFNHFHSKAERIYRVVRNTENSSGIEKSPATPYPFAAAFRNDFSDVPLITQFHDQGELQVTIGKDKFMMEDVIFADSLFFEVFDFEIISGNPGKDLSEPGKIFLTESAAAKLIKHDSITRLTLGNLVDVEVVGIVKDPRPDSDIQFTMIVSRPSLHQDFVGFPIDHWGVNASGYSFIVVPESMTASQIESRFPDFAKKYHHERDRDTRYLLQPLATIHFATDYNDEAVEKSELVVLALLGLFILSLACINFINLATALAVKKSKEIGIRKTLGAVRTQLTVYFLAETFVLTMISLLLSLGLVEWILPWLNFFLEKQLDLSLFSDHGLLLFLCATVFFVTILSGLYPGIILSGYSPVVVLKNKLATQGSSGTSVRKFLVVFQFLIAQALIIGTLVVGDQMQFFKNKPLGFNKEAIVNVSMPEHPASLLETFRSRLEANPNVEKISYSIGAPVTENGLGTNFSLVDGSVDATYAVNVKLADIHYATTYGLQLVAGRWMTESEERLASDTVMKNNQYVFVINESAVRQLGFENPDEILNKKLRIGLNSIEAPVVGVVKDFHTTSMRETINPVIIVNFPYFYYDAGIKINTENVSETLAFIEKTWNDLNPNYYFEYSFLDEHLETLYRQEQRTFVVFKIFSGIAIFIACLGLYGLISFMANQKLKEVGIRKVMGASVPSIVLLFSKEFVKLIVVAFLIAAPVAWYCMDQWLNTFAYHIQVQWSVFVIGILSTLTIALLTVGYRAVKAAITNPVNTLRTE